MKKYIFLIGLITILSAGCKKSNCYTCDRSVDGGPKTDICQNDTTNGNNFNYIALSNGAILTDPNGNSIHCTRK